MDDESPSGQRSDRKYNSKRPLAQLVKAERIVNKRIQPYAPFRNLLGKVNDSEIVGVLKELAQGTSKVMFPKGVGFCELTDYCAPFPQKMRLGDGDCSVKKSKGCKIYQRFQAIKTYYLKDNNDKEALEILAISEETSPIRKDDYEPKILKSRIS